MKRVRVPRCTRSGAGALAGPPPRAGGDRGRPPHPAIHRAQGQLLSGRRGGAAHVSRPGATWSTSLNPRRGSPPPCSSPGPCSIPDSFASSCDKYRAQPACAGAGPDSEGYEFYDITAWSLPLTLGLDAWWTERHASGHRRSGHGHGIPPELCRRRPGPSRPTCSADDSEAGTRLALRLLERVFRVCGATRCR